MKKVLVALALLVTMGACERQSGRREQVKYLHVIEYLKDDSNNVEFIRYDTKDSAIHFKKELDNAHIWNRYIRIEEGAILEGTILY